MLRKEKKCTPLDCWAVPFLVSRCPWFRNHPWFQNHFFWFQNHSWLQNRRFWFQNHPVLVAESSLVSESFRNPRRRSFYQLFRLVFWLVTLSAVIGFSPWDYWLGFWRKTPFWLNWLPEPGPSTNHHFSVAVKTNRHRLREVAFAFARLWWSQKDCSQGQAIFGSARGFTDEFVGANWSLGIEWLARMIRQRGLSFVKWDLRESLAPPFKLHLEI